MYMCIYIYIYDPKEQSYWEREITPGSQGSFGRPSTTSWVVPVRDLLLCRSSQLMPS